MCSSNARRLVHDAANEIDARALGSNAGGLQTVRAMKRGLFAV